MIDYQLNTRLNGNLAMTFCFHENKALQQDTTLGEKLAQEFGIAFYDKELIKLASEESGLCKEFFEKADEKASQSIIGGLFGTRFPFISDGAIPYGSCLSNDALFKIQSDVIRELAEKQSCLFVGRCEVKGIRSATA